MLVVSSACTYSTNLKTVPYETVLSWDSKDKTVLANSRYCEICKD